MGGKTKQQQRTKNNTKPSSSGRSAELLASSAISPSVGFANVAQFGFLPTMLQDFTITDPNNIIDDMDSTLDTNYQLVFRKMMKKDPITKVKALQEFTELVLKTETNTVKSILPFWPRLYNNLSTDTEHRVREAAQQAQAALMNQAGKNIAPYLRQIAPAWISSQYDTYAPAGSIAVQSFQKSFPPHKLQDVFSFCQNEILDYVTKNLTFHTATTLSNPQSNTPEECEAKYQRVLICSLKGYALYLLKISPEHLKEASNKNAALLENGKFWSYHKHKNPGIRAAWFEAQSAILQSTLDLSKFEKQMATAALQALDESESVAQPHVWTAILLVTQKIPNWQTYVNMEKALIPKLWKILKTGGSGNAETIYPHLLPLLSKLNREIFGDKILTFYRNFFEHINTGLCARLIQQSNSRADITAISTSYYECLQYVLIQVQGFPPEQFEADANLTEISLNFLQLHVIDVIDYLLTNATSSNTKYVLVRLVGLLQFWSNTSTENKLYAELLTRFWNDLFGVINNAFGKLGEDRETTAKLDLLRDLISFLRTKPTLPSKVKSTKVKFSIAEEPAPANDPSDSSKNSPSESCDYFENEIADLVINLCKLYMKKTSETTSAVYMKPLEALLSEFGKSAQFFEKLSSSSNDIAKLYDKFASWLLIKQLRSENVLDIILMLYPHMDATEKSKLLNKLVKFPNESVQNWMLSRMLSHPLCTEPDIVRLLSQPTVTALLIKNAQDLTAGKVSETINLLHKCFFQTENGDILIDCKTCQNIVDILCGALIDTNVDDNVLDTCVSFLAQIMPVICSDAEKQNIRNEMFVKLFALCVDKERIGRLSEDTLWEAVTSWQDALSSNDIQLTDELLETCATIVQKNLEAAVLDRSSTVSDIESISEIVSKLILCSVECYEDDDDTKYQTVDKIIEAIFSKISKSHENYLNDCLRSCTFIELLNRHIASTPVAVARLDSELGTLDAYYSIFALLKLAIYKLRVIFKMTCNVAQSRKNSDTDNDNEISLEKLAIEDEHTEDYCDPNESLLKRWSEKIYTEALNGIYLSGLFNSLLDNFNLSPPLDDFILNFQELINLFLANVSEEYVEAITKRLLELSRLEDPFGVNSTLLLKQVAPYKSSENALALLHNDLTKITNGVEQLIPYVNILLAYTPQLDARQLSIASNVFGDAIDLHWRTIGLRCLMKNYFNANSNEMGDQQIINECLKVIDELYNRSKNNKEFLLYNENLATSSTDAILQTTEYIRFLTEVIQTFPGNLSSQQWDFVRIAISSWVLSLSKSSDSWKNPQIAVFMASVYTMFESFYEFINAERVNSSTKVMVQVIDEWEHVFARDVNLILLKFFMKFVQENVSTGDNRQEYFLKTLSQSIDKLDFKQVQVAHKIDSKTSIDDLIRFALQNLSHEYHTVRMACATIIKCMATYLIEKDIEQLGRRGDQDKESNEPGEWHLLHKFRGILATHNEWTQQYIDEFNFKLTELDDFSEIEAEKSIPFLLLWDVIVTICDKASSEIRSTYASFLSDQGFEQTLLQMLFRMMPADVLRNQDLKERGSAYFAHLPWENIVNDDFTPERYACFIYTRMLKHLPAVVRRWWTNSHPRQKILVDKITSAFVSTQLCNDELRALLDKKEKRDSFQISVHHSTREVHATYVIDEARMELIIQLPLNYPLGVVKVSCGQQVGDKLQSPVVVMQLSLFLTHQNGSIWDGLSLWKRNLDRKFDGVEECYVCYSVIHQETYQLPKQVCKTCKKKFHGQCLYKWFSTSNKSTCPICRNMF